jgi:GT2 family glycosyltransferase
MDTLAPPVVAVVVAHDPGPWFEETLASLASQDYAELSVLVLDAGSAEDLTARVAAVLPTAYVRRFEANRGFGATVNEVSAMVDGAAYFLLCHDDVALFTDTVHLMVEEAFRSNAGIVSPKVVSWDDPQRLIHVGMVVDKGGSVVERVHVNEIDHGQHDAVRDVFVAPGGATLVRVDLFDELGGFDPSIVAMGEDLDLCWRAQVVGARIIVAPDARIRHLEELAGGDRPLDQSLFAPKTASGGDLHLRSGGEETPTPGGPDQPGGTSDDPDPEVPAVAGIGGTEVPAGTLAAGVGRPDHPSEESAPRHPVTLQELQRRHELLAAFKCYSTSHLIRVVPQVLILAIGEVIVAELAGNRIRARAVVRAWRWNLGRLPETRLRRKQLKSHRRLGDKEIRVLQLRGSARLSAYLRRVFQYGFHGAHADEMAAADEIPDALVAGAQAAAAVEAGGGTGGAGGTRGLGSPDAAPHVQSRGWVSGRVRVTAWVVAALILLLGSRGVLTGRLPAVGQFTPFPGWTTTWSQFGAGWHPSGVGTTAPATPALALVGLVGTVLLGAMGLAQKFLIFGCLPVGAWGTVRLLRPFGSQRASLVAALAYLAMALPYNALALGRWGALIAYAGTPWVLGRLFRATGTAPYLRAVPGGSTTGHTPGTGLPKPPSSLRQRTAAWLGRHDGLRAALALGLVEAVLISFAPAMAIVVLLAAVALLASSLIGGDWASTRRALSLTVGATIVAVLVCLPWVIGVLLAGKGAVAVFGVPVPASEAATWGSLLRFSVGPIGVSPLAWGFVAAALVPLLLAHDVRFRWAVRLWSIALVFWVLAWVMGNGWTGSLAIDPLILLAPVAAAVAGLIGLGIAAFEEDLRAVEFGWRQLVVVVATGVVVLASLPTLASALPGRWDLPTNDFSQSVSWMQAKVSQGSFRVLWLGDERALNQGSWSAGDGFAYATSEDGPPDARWLWNAAGPGPATGLASAVDLARTNGTNQLGRMLAPAGVRYVVLLTSLAPEISGEQSPEEYPVPADLAPALASQLDLNPVLSGTGITVYDNTAWIPERAAVATGSTASGGTPVANGPADPSALAGAPGAPIVPGASPVLPGPAASRSYTGPLPAGTVLAALAPAGRWSLVAANGASAVRSRSFGWAAGFASVAPGPATLRFRGGVLAPLSLVGSVIVWILAVGLLIGRRLGGPRRAARARRHPVAAARRQPAGSDSPGLEPAEVAP